MVYSKTGYTMLHDTFQSIIFQINNNDYADDEQFKKHCFCLSSEPNHILSTLWEYVTDRACTKHQALFLFREVLDLWTKLKQMQSSGSSKN